MKTRVILFAALLIATVSVNAVAKEEPGNVAFAVVPVKGSDVYKVIYKKEGSTRVRINLYNTSGQVIFTETISQDGFIRPLNFAGLSAGEYTIEVIDGTARVVEKIAFRKEGSANRRVVNVSKVNHEEQKYVFSVANSVNESFVVTIYGQNNEVIFSETTTVNGSKAKLYNVKNGRVSRIEVVDAAGVTSSKRF